MPYIFLPLPKYFEKHIDNRVLERKISNSDIKLLRKWFASGPSVPDGPWCGVLSSGWKVVGKDHLPITILEPHMKCHKEDTTFTII